MGAGGGGETVDRADETVGQPDYWLRQDCEGFEPPENATSGETAKYAANIPVCLSLDAVKIRTVQCFDKGSNLLLGNLIADFFPLAIGVAFSSAPIIALIFVLFGRHARRNGPAFMFGWMAGIAVVGGLALLLANTGRISSGGGSLRLAYSIQFLFGMALLILAFRGWQQRARHGDAQELPDWMASLDAFSTRRIFGLGVTLADVNLKNLFLTIAAAMMISEARLNRIQSWVAWLSSQVEQYHDHRTRNLLSACARIC